MAADDPEIGDRPIAPEAKVKTSVAKQIIALGKKNMKIHMRTNAVPCFSCSLISACCLHFFCPIFFVVCSTFVPWMIIKQTMNEQEQQKFLEVEIKKPKVFKPWPGYTTDTYRMSWEATQHYGYAYTPRPLDLKPFGAVPLEETLWAPKPKRHYDFMSDKCVAYNRGCHCKTLALIGPSASVAAFTQVLQNEANEYWNNLAEFSASQEEAVHTLTWEVMPRSSRRLSETSETISESSAEDGPAAPPALQQLGMARRRLREMTSELPDIMVDLLTEAVGARRLNQTQTQSSGSQRDRKEDCEEDMSPILESEYCDVNPGHNGTIFRTFASVEDLDKFIDSADYGRYPRDRSGTSSWDRLCGAVIFNNDVLSAGEPSYTIRLNVTLKDLEAGEGITNERTRPVHTGDGFNKWYYHSGFIYLQHLVHTTLTQRRASTPTAPLPDLLRGQPHIVPAPTLEERSWGFGGVVGGILGNPLTLCIMFGPIVSAIAYYMSRERASRQRELMRMMGLSDFALLWSWVLLFVAFNFGISLVMTMFFRAFFFLKTDFFICWMLIFWFSNATLTFGMFISAFASTERMAALASLAGFFALSFSVTAVNASSPSWLKVLLSFLPPPAFFLTFTAVWSWEEAGLGGTFSTSNSMVDNYSIAIGIWMLFIDSWVYLGLYYYFDNVIWWHNVGVARKPCFCFTGSYWREVMGKPPQVDTAASDEATADDGLAAGRYVQSEDDVHLKAMIQSNRCVIIRKLNKSFVNAAGQKVQAVQDLSLTLYQDECFCLLGHNGAGKTTTMMMLTGCLPQSSGSIKIKGFDVPRQIRDIRTSMGFCPQHNVLFNELTVMEHLEVFGSVGGMTPQYIQQRGRDLCHAVALSDKMQTRAAALSGGMKRKLSAALAFLAEPYLVILDEPSSGMDPFARRAMWNTLKQWRTGHILCLTTHYMDEADALGDRIAIMSNGQLACSGSSNFLKRQFGCGYVISFAKTNESPAHNTSILRAVREELGDADIMSAVGKEVLVQVPFTAAEKFPTLFPKLERNKVDLGIESYGTSVTNLEEVFLKVARMEKEVSKSQSNLADGVNPTAGAAPDTWTSPEAQAGTRQAGFFLQLGALIIRRFKFGYRNRGSCACQIGLPIAGLFLFCMIMKLTQVTSLGPLVLDTSEWNKEVEGSRVPITVGTAAGHGPAVASAVQAMWSNSPAVTTVYDAPAVVATPYRRSASPFSTNASMMNGILTGVAEESSFATAMLGNEKKSAASQYAGVFYPSASSWCPATRTTVCPAVGITIMTNLTAPHAGPALFNAHAAVVLKHRGSGITNIKVTNHPLQQTLVQIGRAEFLSGIFAALIIMATYGFIPSGVTSYVVMEKEKDVKNQLIISGCGYAAYWCSNLIFDVLWGLIPASAAWIIFAVYDVGAFVRAPGLEASIALFIAFLPCMAGFAYLFSFLFKKSGAALLISWLFNLGFGILTVVTISILRGISSAYDVMVFMRWMFRFVPIFSLGWGHLIISFSQRSAKEKGVGALAGIGVGGTVCDDPATVRGEYRKDERCAYMVGDEFLILMISGVIYLVLTIVFDTVGGMPCFKRIFGSGKGLTKKVMASNEHSNEDSMVLSEKERVKTVDHSKQFVFVDEVHKVYNNRFHAVRGISFAASEGQVFGLLGVNGAGKTTTFKMLCGQVEPTAGQVYIQGYNITTQAAQARRLIGYCPQFDALLDSLTVKEHLYLYGRLKGLTGGELVSSVSNGISDLDLMQYVESRAGQLSGGNKRKLSVAMATISEPPMVFLDEPSAGMDPVARRGMWSVIQNIADRRKRSVVILTTHSMEEAEALCSRIAIQVDGQFRCLGTAQQIKSNYGQGLELNIRLTTPTQTEITECCTKLGGTPSQQLDASAAASRVEAAYGKAAVEELLARPGSPFLGTGSAPMALLAEWTVLAVWTKAFESFTVAELRQESGGQPVLMSLEKAQNVLRYQVLPAALQGRFKSLGALFSLFQSKKEEYSIEDFQVCQTSLEQVFNRFATKQASQAGSQPTAASPPSVEAPTPLETPQTAPAPASQRPPPEPEAPEAPTTFVAYTRS